MAIIRDWLYGWRATLLAMWDDYRCRNRPGYQEWDPTPLERPTERQ